MAFSWQHLQLPIVGLSPMDGVTDHPFRHIHKKYGNPDLVFTEFTSVEGVCHGAARLLSDFLFDESQRPVIAQIYGTTPTFFQQTATLICELGYDGIDINMGCPAKNVAHSGAGAALITTPDLALEIIRATKAGVQDFLNGRRAADCPDISPEIAAEVARRHSLLPSEYQTPREVPVSVKTRIGYDKKVVDWWIPTLLEESPAAITVHGRTLKQQYGGQADWEEIAKGVQYCAGTDTRYLGNGDVHSRAEAVKKCQEYGVDGVLIGRASFGNPAVFRVDYQADESQPPSPEHFAIALEHARLYEQTYGHHEKYSFLPMRKHLGWYVKSIPQATIIRQEIFRTDTPAEVAAIFQKYNLV